MTEPASEAVDYASPMWWGGRSAPGQENEQGLRTLGRSGIKVTSLCLGSLMLAGPDTDEKESIRIVHRALDAGINFIDSADIYALGECEKVVGKALKGRRDDVVLGTKFHGQMHEDPNSQGASRRWIARAVDESLRRLQTDWIDLYQVHRPSPDTDIDETLGALTDLVSAGKVRAIGCSAFAAYEIVESHWVSERRGRERFRTEQPGYSMLVRDVEADVLPVCERHGMSAIVWGPLAGGWLSGRYRLGREGKPSETRASLVPEQFDFSLPVNQRKLEAVEALHGVAEQAGLTLVELALAFVLRHPAVAAAIVGPRTMEQLESQLGAAEISLDHDVLDRIDAIVAPGTSVNPADVGYTPQILTEPWRRRR
jgi:aryl-alcohol dehydrogenase-like predicted oxidoreductase